MSKSQRECLTKRNYLFYQKATEPKEERKSTSKKPPTYTATVDRIQPKIIRIYTTPEIKKLIPPPRNTKKALIRKQRILLPMIGVGSKMLIAAACVYLSYDIGLWGTAEDTENLYKKFCNLRNRRKDQTDNLLPPTCAAQKERFPFNRSTAYCQDDVPVFCSEKIIENFQTTWNHAVQTVVTTLVQLPSTVSEYIEDFKLDQNNNSNDELPKMETLCECCKVESKET